MIPVHVPVALNDLDVDVTHSPMEQRHVTASRDALVRPTPQRRANERGSGIPFVDGPLM